MEKPPKPSKNIESIQATLDNKIEETRIRLEVGRAYTEKIGQMIAEGRIQNELDEIPKEDTVLIKELEAAMERSREKVATLEKKLEDLYRAKLHLIDPDAKPN